MKNRLNNSEDPHGIKIDVVYDENGEPVPKLSLLNKFLSVNNDFPSEMLPFSLMCQGVISYQVKLFNSIRVTTISLQSGS